MPDSSPAVTSKHQNQKMMADGETAWQQFSVSYEYPVCFTDEIFSPGNPTLVNAVLRLEANTCHKVMVFIDEGLVEAVPTLVPDLTGYSQAHRTTLHLVAEPIILPGGERIKNDTALISQMRELLAAHRVDRHSFVIGVGGGALLDAVGLVAATSHRGIRHIRIPTTVLSQNDSGVGVKNGVNLFGQKNYLGTFCPPFAVINDYAFIRALSARDKTAGISEAVKVALIRDAAFYRWLEQHTTELCTFDEPAMQYMIRRCAELHMHQIANGGDPFETGNVRPLDYGHWSAHKLESLSGYQLRHGEAVAIGLALDTHYSVLTGLLAPGADERVHSLLETLGFALWHEMLELRDSAGELELLKGLREFREHLGGKLTITLLSDIGTGIEVHEIEEQLVAQSIQWLKRHAGS